MTGTNRGHTRFPTELAQDRACKSYHVPNLRETSCDLTVPR